MIKHWPKDGWVYRWYAWFLEKLGQNVPEEDNSCRIRSIVLQAGVEKLRTRRVPWTRLSWLAIATWLLIVCVLLLLGVIWPGLLVVIAYAIAIFTVIVLSVVAAIWVLGAVALVVLLLPCWFGWGPRLAEIVKRWPWVGVLGIAIYIFVIQYVSLFLGRHGIWPAWILFSLLSWLELIVLALMIVFLILILMAFIDGKKRVFSRRVEAIGSSKTVEGSWKQLVSLWKSFKGKVCHKVIWED